MSVEARKLKGFRDFLPQQAEARWEIIQTVKAMAKLAGFQHIETPALEYAEVLLGTGHEETDKEVYRFRDHGDRDVGLRFDLTVPFARYVSENYPQLHFPFKKFQWGEVWRGEKPQKGRYRQFAQADLDIIGADSLTADVDVMLTLVQALEHLLPPTCTATMTINHRALLTGLMRSLLSTTDAAQETQALIAIDKLAKIGADAVRDLLIAQIGVTAAAATGFVSFLQTFNGDQSAWDNLHITLTTAGPEIQRDVARIRDTVLLMQELSKQGRVKVRCDLSIARGLGYYTGVVFETTIDQLPGFGSVSSGGRYNNLVGRFGKYNLAGVGGSIGVDRLLAACEELQSPQKLVPAQIFIAIATADAVGYALGISQEIRQAGISCDVAAKYDKLGAQFKHADQLGIPLVLTVGSDEAAKQEFSLKVLSNGQDHKQLKRTGLISEIRRYLSATS